MLLTVALLGLALAMLCTTQPWSDARRVDPAGLVWEAEVAGASLAPLAGALLPVAVCAVLVAQAIRGRGRLLLTGLATLAAAGAAASTLLAAPSGATPWWWLAGASTLVAALALALLVLTDARAATRGTVPVTVPERHTGTLPPHEHRRRSEAATWAALSHGQDPTASPSPRGDGAAGRMSSDSASTP
ncbi:MULTISPECIES: hypothetical protein [unclassified Serinicoccus]|uniref:hypothetical protein n=1 Tax=unclassified Serinicoccus TaxID=2643101 RepID=UPI003851DD98